jgi:hypothetical protein
MVLDMALLAVSSIVGSTAPSLHSRRDMAYEVHQDCGDTSSW